MHMNAMLCQPDLPPFWLLCSHKKGPINNATCSAEAVMAWRPAFLELPCFSSWGAEGGSSKTLSGEKPFSAWCQTCLKIRWPLPPHAPCYYGENEITFGSWDPHPTSFSFPVVLKGSRTLQWNCTLCTLLTALLAEGYGEIFSNPDDSSGDLQREEFSTQCQSSAPVSPCRLKNKFDTGCVVSFKCRKVSVVQIGIKIAALIARFQPKYPLKSPCQEI